jgi:hypothetical protein
MAGASTIRWSDVKSDADRWRWHAEVYAFRRVVLGVSYDLRTSPCDLKGEWFDAYLVDEATRRYQRHYANKRAFLG